MISYVRIYRHLIYLLTHQSYIQVIIYQYHFISFVTQLTKLQYKYYPLFSYQISARNAYC